MNAESDRSLRGIANEVPMIARRGFYGWRLVFVLWAIMIVTLGLSSYGGAVMNAFMVNDLHLTRATLGLGFTVFTLAAGFSAPLAARLVNSVGARLTLAFGTSMIALGALLLAVWVTQGWRYVLAFGLLGMGYGSGGMIPAQSCVAMWFSRKRAFAMSVVLTGSGAGGFIATHLLARLIGAAGGNWKAGWHFVLAAAMSAGLVSVLLVRNSPKELGQQPDGGTADEESPAACSDAPASGTSVYKTTYRWTLHEAARTRAMWLICLAAIGFAIPSTAVIAHGIPNLRDLGHSADEAASALGLLALCSVIGKLGAGILCDRLEPRYVWCACNLIVALGVLVVAQAHSVSAMYLFAILLGIGSGACLACWPATVANYFGPIGFASVLGAQVPFSNAFAAIAPLLVGVAHDTQGTYATSFYIIAAFGAVTALLLLAAAPPTPFLASVT